MEFIATNTNDLAYQVYPYIAHHGVKVKTRNGPAIRIPGVTTVKITKPWQRVNMSYARDANPFFHLIESMAMLSGDIGNSVKLLSFFASNMTAFSDNGKDYNAFYGTRARKTYGDQLAQVVKNLKASPGSRQELVLLWNPQDLTAKTKDKACNLCMLFEIDEETCCVNMTTFNRSNDAIWGGITGANVVHLAFFQEYVACALGASIGEWNHVSANLHVYVDNPKWKACLEEAEGSSDSLVHREYPWDHQRLFRESEQRFFDLELRAFNANLLQAILHFDQHQERAIEFFKENCYNCSYLEHTAKTMALAYFRHKMKETRVAIGEVSKVRAEDWQFAAINWLVRRV
jgi:thymidylate synthase